VRKRDIRSKYVLGKERANVPKRARKKEPKNLILARKGGMVIKPGLLTKGYGSAPPAKVKGNSASPGVVKIETRGGTSLPGQRDVPNYKK